jgi:hypothetical protein
MKDFNLFVRFLKFLQRRWTAALPEGRVCHFAHLRNRSTIGNAFSTTQLIPPAAAFWAYQETMHFF